MTFIRRTAATAMIALLLLGGLAAHASQQSGITAFFFTDKRADGIYMEGEDLIDKVEVTLMRAGEAGDTAVAAAVSDHTGYVQFLGIPAGEYYLQFILPGGYVPTRYLQSGSQAIPSSTKGGRSVPITLGEGQLLTDLPIGMISNKQAGYLRAVAFGDDNLNGGRFSSEPLLRGVLLEALFEHEGNYYVAGDTLTDKEGIGTISNLAPGPYVLAATLPGSYIIGPLGAKVSLFYNSIIPAEGNYGRSAPVELPLGGSVGMGVGGATTGSASGFAWEDLNMDGRRGSDEPGAAGVKIELTHLSMGITRELTTGQTGSFVFPSLQPGEYTLKASLPDDKMFTIGGFDSMLTSDTSLAAARTVMIAEETDTDLGGVGLIPPTSLEVLAYHDGNVNGQREEGEPAFAGAKLEAFRGNQLLGTSMTDAQGIALLPLLRGQDMELRMSLPDGQVFSVSGENNSNHFSAFTAENQITAPYTLSPGTRGQLQAAVTLPAQASGRIFDDMNSNAVWDEGEGFLPGFSLQALDARGEVVAEAVTDNEGRYHFPKLLPGSYELRLLLKSPYIFSGAPAVSGEPANVFLNQTAQYGIAQGITLAAGSSQDKLDGAIFRSGVIEGQVLLGDEHDGFAGAQGGLPGVLVELLDEDMQPVSRYTVATTDAAGNFLLKGALPGIYSLRYGLPSGASFSRPLTDEKSVVSARFVVKAADELRQEPLFAVQTGSYAGRAYLDLNVNGSFDEGDQPLRHVSIKMDSDTPANSREALAGDDGSYQVQNLRPGTYRLQASFAEGQLVSFDPLSPLSPAAGNQNSTDITIGMGEQVTDKSLAAVPAHSVSGRLYFDNNLDRRASEDERGIPGLRLKWRHNLSKVEFSADSDAAGRYSIPLLFPGSYTMSLGLPEDMEIFSEAPKYGNTHEVTLTLDSKAAQTNRDFALVRFGSLSGQAWNMDGSNEAVNDLSLTLYHENGEEAGRAVTDASGNYRFEGLYPGSYRLQAVLRDGYRFAREVDSQRTRFSLITTDGSEVDRHVGKSPVFALTMAEHKAGQDIGLGTMGRLGDYAWLDMDRDGMQDAGEPGVPGILVRAYQYEQLAAETTTDAWGRYIFGELYPGSYRIEVTMPPELEATKQQSEFKLVASVLPQTAGTVVSAQNIVVPSAGRNLNADFGFALVREGELPDSMRELPAKDWTPLVPTVPKRVR